MPCELLAGHRHFFTVVRNNRELVREVLGIERIPDIRPGENGVSAVWFDDRLQEHPALQEAVRVWRLWLRRGLREVGRNTAGSGGRCAFRRILGSCRALRCTHRLNYQDEYC